MPSMAYQRNKRKDRQTGKKPPTLSSKPADKNSSPSKDDSFSSSSAITSVPVQPLVKFSSPKRIWALDEHGSQDLNHGVMVPVGFIKGKFHTEEVAKAVDSKQEMIKGQAMATARAPVQQLFMTCMMLWMSGSTLQIFSIMMLSMAIWTPVQALFNVNKVFERFVSSGVDLVVPKLIYIAINFAGIGVGLYKMNTLGLLPSASDWLTDLPTRTAMEFSLSPVL
eukprot:gb/GEZN01016579.1/.p1 GENE.gb/GEZN01016579.1/~~gb/GEZN01016579.1/.p1  ORF type:complete len:223 (-),score=37.50 gb/GEZN01016579.1/:107-775(-)